MTERTARIVAEYIEREKVYKRLTEMPVPWGMGWRGVMDEIFRTVGRVPAADVHPEIHAKWEICCDGYYPYCSNCKREPQGREMTRYCPNCGAIMDRKDGENNAEN